MLRYSKSYLSEEYIILRHHQCQMCSDISVRGVLVAILVTVYGDNGVAMGIAMGMSMGVLLVVVILPG